MSRECEGRLRRAARGNRPARLPKECGRDPTSSPLVFDRSSTPSRHGCPGPCFQRKRPSLSRQGHPTVAHRFNGGNAVPTTRRVPPGTAEACESRGRVQRKQNLRAKFCRPCRGCGRPATRGPTAEAVGYFRMSLAGQRGTTVAFRLGEACDFPVFHTSEALRWRTETLRRMATALLPKSLGTRSLAGRLRSFRRSARS